MTQDLLVEYVEEDTDAGTGSTPIYGAARVVAANNVSIPVWAGLLHFFNDFGRSPSVVLANSNRPRVIVRRDATTSLEAETACHSIVISPVIGATVRSKVAAGGSVADPAAPAARGGFATVAVTDQRGNTIEGLIAYLPSQVVPWAVGPGHSVLLTSLARAGDIPTAMPAGHSKVWGVGSAPQNPNVVYSQSTFLLGIPVNLDAAGGWGLATSATFKENAAAGLLGVCVENITSGGSYLALGGLYAQAGGVGTLYYLNSGGTLSTSPPATGYVWPVVAQVAVGLRMILPHLGMVHDGHVFLAEEVEGCDALDAPVTKWMAAEPVP
jgi:hypothetical protein